MTSKAEQLRRKKAHSAKLPELAAIEKPEQHRVGGRFAKDTESPLLAPLEARSRVSGIGVPHGPQRRSDRKKTRLDDLKDHAAPWMGTHIGWVMHYEG